MSAGEGEFTVSVTKEEVVAAPMVLRMQEHWLPLSNLDLLLPPLDVGVFFCYKKPMLTSTGGNVTNKSNSTMSFGSMVGSLKNALAQALVSYYAFAGEVGTNSMDEPELLCNNRGVDFVEAVADVELQCLNLYKPDDTVEGRLVPRKEHGVLAVQATLLRCGGLVVACTFDHRIADAYSANMFLVSWAQIARLPCHTISTSSPINPARPSFRRSLLSPRRPVSVPPSLHDMYVPVSKLPLPPPPQLSKLECQPRYNSLTSRIYYIAGEQLIRIQSLANSNGVNYHTKLESFCAFLWKTVAAAAAVIKDGDKRVVAKMGIVVDGRKRLGQRDENKAALMGSYFGNVISVPFDGKTVEELLEKPLSWVADQVHGFLAAATTEEHFLGLIDWVEAHRPVQGLARIYCHGGTGDEDGPAFVVSSGQRFPQSKVDFGWGKPSFASYHFPWGGHAEYVMPMPSPVGNGDWVVYMHLLEEQLEILEYVAGHVFKPFAWDYFLNREYVSH